MKYVFYPVTLNTPVNREVIPYNYKAVQKEYSLSSVQIGKHNKRIGTNHN